MSLSVDDLLKEFDDLPGGSKGGVGRGVRAAPPAEPVRRESTPAHGQPQNTRSSTPASTSQASTAVGSRCIAGGKKDELEALLSDLDFGGTPYNSMNGRNNPRAVAAAEAAVQKLSAAPSRKPSVIGSKQKCTGVFIGGTSFARGRMGAVGTLTCCDALRCTKCDFRVEQFNNRDWNDDVDYLFFRNNFPAEDKLAAKMRSRQGSMAYCCQCSWLSTIEQSKLDFSSEVRWVCAGHLAE
ncbi:hypothetical protein PLESTB_000841600 [Pleodorina starrii]|uniref:Cilia- and flagella-associated protein 418 n=1 Tax=Pleodorina starrii TaxID=330485 RepID=A0A9W6F2K1_9CHLO|nr:hypothetical protein PLESTM_000157400 [Pleodorina starrii]GLC54268.1 hypothetical protein PLESTB_000841600 [Pleodorina starrii]GLC64431.1 hypothetical protein PLESTF_000165300 [Pleodorina starrii]